MKSKTQICREQNFFQETALVQVLQMCVPVISEMTGLIEPSEK